MRLNSAKDLDVYKKSYQLVMKVFEISKSFPAEEKFALTSQMRLHHAGAASRDGVALPAGWQDARKYDQ